MNPDQNTLQNQSSPVLFYQEGTCALGALISLVWVDQPFRLARLESGDSDNADYLTLNPMGEVPTLFLNGTIITENVAILQHIAGTDLKRGLTFQQGTPEHDQMNRALGFLASSFHKGFHPLFGAADFHPDPKVQGEIRKHVIAGPLREVLQVTNDHVLRSELMWDQPMIGDAYLFAMARWAENFFDLERDFPHIVRFQKRMAQDPGVQTALAIERGLLTEARDGSWSHVDFAQFVGDAVAMKREVDHLHHEGDFTPGLESNIGSQVGQKQKRSS